MTANAGAWRLIPPICCANFATAVASSSQAILGSFSRVARIWPGRPGNGAATVKACPSSSPSDTGTESASSSTSTGTSGNCEECDTDLQAFRDWLQSEKKDPTPLVDLVALLDRLAKIEERINALRY